MKEWAIDLHLHSCLSPCGGEEMTPPAVLERALALGYDALAVTDHNTAENVVAFMEKGREKGIIVIPGMELQTREDVHLVCLFDRLGQVLDLQETVYDKLPPLANKCGLGEQVLVDKEGNRTGWLERLLLVGTDLSVEKAVDEVHRLGGICIASHLDRQAFSLWGHLGKIPPDLALDGGELTPRLPRSPLLLKELQERRLTCVVSSDAHYLADMTFPRCFAFMAECTVGEIKKALKGKDGRYIRTTV
ncbi:MAG: PHP domain-containing protein [Peptococcaceae bacterium]|jgi:hypothetical protein|nr:PHP domain-containing protein [Peptococcaceae bacterium]MDH7524235.1 PHP domain-containing protein [Peptococcaceae bacterium]